MKNKGDLEKEHNLIEGFLSTLEKMIDSKYFDPLYVKQIFRDLKGFWETHEEKEELFFTKIRRNADPEVDKLLFDHRQLRGHRRVVEYALKTEDNDKIRIALDTDGKMLIDKLRAHMDEEEMFLQNRMMNRMK